MSLVRATIPQRFVIFPKVPLSLIISFLLLSIMFMFYGTAKYKDLQTEKNQTIEIVSAPQVNDIIFLDFRVLTDKLRPHEKYRIAKVVDITGDIVTLLYSDFFYQYQNAAVNSIQYGQLRYKDYFQPKRYDIPLSTLKDMLANKAIYLAKRPVRNRLFGSFVGPTSARDTSSHLTLGKKENTQGESFLNDPYDETRFETAFSLFMRSATQGYVKGQVNLAQMYLNGQYVEKDLNLALYWLNQASLQSYKPAILKYGIVCKQVKSCDLVDFYQTLIDSGVNIKVRELDFRLN